MAKLYLGTREVTPGIFSTPPDYPSYTIDNGKIKRRRIDLTGTEFANVTEIDSYGLMYNFEFCDVRGVLNLSNVTKIQSSGMKEAFANTGSHLTSVDLSSLTTVSINSLANAFAASSGITSADLSSLVDAGYYSAPGIFANCTSLTSVDFSSLTTIGASGLQSAFEGCTSLQTMRFPSLTTIGNATGIGNMFKGCTALENVYFNSLINVAGLNTILANTGTNVTHTLHFPSNLESTIQGLTGYPLFGGISGYVTLAFDLPATS